MRGSASLRLGVSPIIGYLAAGLVIGPFTPGFDLAEFGDLKSLETKMDDDTVAVLVEPVQAEVVPRPVQDAGRQIDARDGRRARARGTCE